ncbi:hypothetical protein ACHWQZ_G017733 [Mnemiopsis leidyi]
MASQRKGFDYLFKLLLIGDSGVGKTCILFRFSDDAFNSTFISTIGIDFKINLYIHYRFKTLILILEFDREIINYQFSNISSLHKTSNNRHLPGIDFKIKTIELHGKKIKLQIWDTAGQERFQTITTSYYRGAMGIMLVYDITQSSSFGNINKWLRNIEDHATDNVAKLILGNKCDMEARRVVPTDQGEQLAKSKGLKFLETSAKANINIDKAFTMIAEDILQKTPNPSLRPVDPVIDPRESQSSSGCAC